MFPQNGYKINQSKGLAMRRHSEVIRLRVPATLSERLRTVAAVEERTISEITRDCLRKGLAERSPVAERDPQAA